MTWNDVTKIFLVIFLQRALATGRKTPAAVYGLAKENDFDMIKTDDRGSAIDLTLASVTRRGFLA